MTPQDPSPRAAARRILDVAIDAFAADGFSAVTVRRIATEADVSPALVLHHYGSKAGLRAACDAQVITRIMDTKRQRGAEAGQGLSPFPLQQLMQEAGGETAWRYLVRAVLEDTTHGRDVFHQLVTATERVLVEGWPGVDLHPVADARATAVALTAQSLAPLLFAPHAARELGIAQDAPVGDVLLRLSPALMDLYAHGLFTLREGDAS